MKKLHLKVLTIEKTVYDDFIDEIKIPTLSGEIGVHGNHTPMVSIIKTGEMIIKKDSNEIPLFIQGGVIEVRPGSEAVILADEVEHLKDIKIEEVEIAYTRAKIAMENHTKELDVDFAQLEVTLSRELARLKAAQKWR